MSGSSSLNNTQKCRYEVLLKTSAIIVSEFHCNGLPERTELEAATYPEIVMPQSGAYIRRDESGTVYLDETVVGFFEARRPFIIEHLQPRPDVTTVIAIRNINDLANLFEESSREKTLFGKSAIRATPELHLTHKQLLTHAKGENKDSLATEEAATLLTILAVEESRAAPDLSNVQGARTISEDLIVCVAEYVRTRFKEKLTLDEISDQFGYSVFHLCRLFNARMKMSLYQYVKLLRLESAHAALIETNQPITTIALDHGFSSHAHFTSQFSSWFGLSPTSVRKGEGRKNP